MTFPTTPASPFVSGTSTIGAATLNAWRSYFPLTLDTLNGGNYGNTTLIKWTDGSAGWQFDAGLAIGPTGVQTIQSGGQFIGASGSVVSFVSPIKLAGFGNTGSPVVVTDNIDATGKDINCRNFTISGALGTTGNMTVGGTLGVTGLVTCNGGLTVASGTTTCGTLHSTGNATVDGTLTVGTVLAATASVNNLGSSNNITAAAITTANVVNVNRTGPEIPTGSGAYRGDRAAVNAPAGSATVQGDAQECLRLAIPTTAGADITTTITGRTKPGYLLVTRLQNGGMSGNVTIALAGTAHVTSITFKEGTLEEGAVLLYWDGTDYRIVSMSTGNPLTTPLTDVFTIP